MEFPTFLTHHAGPQCESSLPKKKRGVATNDRSPWIIHRVRRWCARRRRRHWRPSRRRQSRPGFRRKRGFYRKGATFFFFGGVSLRKKITASRKYELMKTPCLLRQVFWESLCNPQLFDFWIFWGCPSWRGFGCLRLQKSGFCGIWMCNRFFFGCNWCMVATWSCLFLIWYKLVTSTCICRELALICQGSSVVHRFQPTIFGGRFWSLRTFSCKKTEANFGWISPVSCPSKSSSTVVIAFVTSEVSLRRLVNLADGVNR